MYVQKCLKFYDKFTSSRALVFSHLNSRFLVQVYFVRDYYLLNDLLWQDGFLIDFLQKKVVDKWTRKFLVYSAYLFNERMVFDKVVRFYIDTVFWPTQHKFIFEYSNVASTLFITLFTLIVVFLSLVVLSLSYVLLN